MKYNYILHISRFVNKIFYLELEQGNGLICKLLSVENSLCSTEPGVTCFWEGILAIKLEIEGKTVNIDDHDVKHNKSSTITVNGKTYTFQGTKFTGSSIDPFLHFTIYVNKT